MNFKYTDFITNKAYHPMGEALLQLPSVQSDIFEKIVQHVFDEYVPDPVFVEEQVGALMRRAPQHLYNRLMDIMYAYSDIDDLHEFVTFFLSYAPLTLALDVSILEGMRHPKNFFQVLDRTELKRCHENICLFVMRTAVDNAMLKMKTDPMCMQPAIDHCQTGLKRIGLFQGDYSQPSGTYDHPDLLAAYNHLYLFR